MKITLDDVRDCLRKPFGVHSFAAGFITSVTSDDSVPTACISANGALRYNASFVSRWVTTSEDLFCLLAHELCHCLFRHEVHGYGYLENLGEDSLINAFLTHAYPNASGNGRLFSRYYPSEGIAGLLRPESDMGTGRYAGLYQQLYTYTGTKVTSGEIIRTLRILAEGDVSVRQVVLLGSHDGPGEHLPPDVLDGIAGDFENTLPHPRAAGVGGALVTLFRQRLRDAQSIRKAALIRYTTQRRVDRFLVPRVQQRIRISPLPLHPTKRELVLVSAGYSPVHYRSLVPIRNNVHRGLAVYLDVSGSVQEDLPQILAILKRMEGVVRSAHLFSTKVEEVPFVRLMAGQIQTTFGTSFDCVAQSIVEKGYDKAVILTDGFAALSADRSKQLQEKGANLLTILFGGATACAPLKPHGDVVELRHVVA